jgi:hypothetical protein
MGHYIADTEIITKPSQEIMLRCSLSLLRREPEFP